LYFDRCLEYFAGVRHSFLFKSCSKRIELADTLAAYA